MDSPQEITGNDALMGAAEAGNQGFIQGRRFSSGLATSTLRPNGLVAKALQSG